MIAVETTNPDLDALIRRRMLAGASETIEDLMARSEHFSGYQHGR